MRRRWTTVAWRKAVLILVACGFAVSLLPFFLLVVHTSSALSGRESPPVRASVTGEDDILDIEKWLDDHEDEIERERQNVSHEHPDQPHRVAEIVSIPRRKAMKQECASVHPQWRIAVLCPWVTRTSNFPPWFDPYFLAPLGRSSLIADWLIFHEGLATPHSLPSNAKLIDVGAGGTAQLIASGIGTYLDWGERNVTLANKYLRFMLYKWPRLVAEYKPAFGKIFETWLSPYSHWAYADLDSAFGSLPGFVEAAELREYDIVSYTFGDHDALYLRGQWTMHRRGPKVDGVWASCAHLSHGLLHELMLKVRYVQAAEAKGVTNYRKRFISAEGCYSAAALSPQAGLNVKLSNKQFVGLTQKSRSEIIVANGAVWQCPARAGVDIRALLRMSKIDCDEALPGPHLPAGQAVPFEPLSEKKCAAWIEPENRICANASFVRATMDVIVRSGNFSAQVVHPRPRVALDNGCRQAALFHFQEWKKSWDVSAVSSSADSDLDQITAFKISVNGIFRL